MKASKVVFELAERVKPIPKVIQSVWPDTDLTKLILLVKMSSPITIIFDVLGR